MRNDYLAVLAMPNLLATQDYVCDDAWLAQFRQYAILPPEQPYTGNHRLGFYYQWLWQQLLTYHPHYVLLEEEVQLQWNKQTIGSIDFLVKNLLTQELEHWEVAIKFYLAFQNQWPGPNAKDNLDKKAARMITHQLALSDHPAYSTAFKHKPTQRRLIMQGRLFTAWPQQQMASTIATNPHAFNGYWCYQSDALSLTLKSLSKRQWIAPPLFEELTEYLSPQSITVPTQALDQHNTVWFIVPDHWPTHNRDR